MVCIQDLAYQLITIQFKSTSPGQPQAAYTWRKFLLLSFLYTTQDVFPEYIIKDYCGFCVKLRRTDAIDENFKDLMNIFGIFLYKGEQPGFSAGDSVMINPDNTILRGPFQKIKEYVKRTLLDKNEKELLDTIINSVNSGDINNLKNNFKIAMALIIQNKTMADYMQLVYVKNLNDNKSGNDLNLNNNYFCGTFDKMCALTALEMGCPILFEKQEGTRAIYIGFREGAIRETDTNIDNFDNTGFDIIINKNHNRKKNLNPDNLNYKINKEMKRLELINQLENIKEMPSNIKVHSIKLLRDGVKGKEEQFLNKMQDIVNFWYNPNTKKDYIKKYEMYEHSKNDYMQIRDLTLTNRNRLLERSGRPIDFYLNQGSITQEGKRHSGRKQNHKYNKSHWTPVKIDTFHPDVNNCTIKLIKKWTEHPLTTTNTNGEFRRRASLKTYEEYISLSEFLTVYNPDLLEDKDIAYKITTCNYNPYYYYSKVLNNNNNNPTDKTIINYLKTLSESKDSQIECLHKDNNWKDNSFLNIVIAAKKKAYNDYEELTKLTEQELDKGIGKPKVSNSPFKSPNRNNIERTHSNRKVSSFESRFNNDGEKKGGLRLRKTLKIKRKLGKTKGRKVKRKGSRKRIRVKNKTKKKH
jgi:hypothetical protein